MAKRIAVMHTGSNNIITIVEGSNPINAARRADAERNMYNRNFKQAANTGLAAEYAIYELDDSDYKLLNDPDRFTDHKYTTYVRANCKHIANMIVA